MINALLSRKFIIALFVISLSFVLVLLNKIDQIGWISIAGISIGAFTAGNILEKQINGKKVENHVEGTT